MARTKAATLEELKKEPGKAELVDGEIVRMPPTGFLSGYTAMRILFSLHEYAQTQKNGYAVGDNVGFVVDLPRRKSFGSDAAYAHSGMKFLEELRYSVVELRGEVDCASKTEQALAKKRADYFAAGTLVVWGVDMLAADVGRLAKARPVLPRMPVEDLFP